MKKDLFILNERYTPDKILHRQKELMKLEEVFNNFEGNLFLYGHSGTGKSACIKNVMKRNVGKYLYASVMDKLTAKKIFKFIFDSPSRTFDVLVERLKEDLINNPKILIFDEIDKIYHSEIEKFFNVLNAIYRETSVPIILIANNPHLLEKIPANAASTFFFRRIVFSPYDAIQLRDIIKDRLKIIETGTNIKVPDSSLEYICAKSKLGISEGSARQALYMTYRCLLQDDFSFEFIDSIEKEIQRQDWEQWISSLKEFERNFLSALVRIHEREILINGKNGEISVPQIQRELNDLSPQRISQLITAFQNNGVIDTRYINKGKMGGRYRLINFSDEKMYSKLSGLL